MLLFVDAAPPSILIVPVGRSGVAIQGVAHRSRCCCSAPPRRRTGSDRHRWRTARTPGSRRATLPELADGADGLPCSAPPLAECSSQAVVRGVPALGPQTEEVRRPGAQERVVHARHVAEPMLSAIEVPSVDVPGVPLDRVRAADAGEAVDLREVDRVRRVAGVAVDQQRSRCVGRRRRSTPGSSCSSGWAPGTCRRRSTSRRCRSDARPRSRSPRPTRRRVHAEREEVGERRAALCATRDSVASGLRNVMQSA